MVPFFVLKQKQKKEKIAKRTNQLDRKIGNSVLGRSAVGKSDAKLFGIFAVAAAGQEAADPPECMKQRKERNQKVEVCISVEMILPDI